MRVGSELKAARKRAGISVDLISKRTKVKVSTLVALEKADFKNLPAGLYLFSMVRAYAREVHIDPEPIVQQLRAEFAEKDALDALHALHARGALTAKKVANARRSTEEHSNFFGHVTLAIGVALMAAVGAGGYLYAMRGSVPRLRSTNIVRSSRTPAANSSDEAPLVPLSAPEPASTAATAIDPPQQAASAMHTPESTKSHSPKSRTAALTQAPQETVTTISAMSDGLGSSVVIPQIEFPSPAPTEEPADKPANAEDFRPAP